MLTLLSTDDNPGTTQSYEGVYSKVDWKWVSNVNCKRCPCAGHSATVSDIAFSPDGLRVATGSEDGTTIVWDAVHCPWDQSRSLRYCLP